MKRDNAITTREIFNTIEDKLNRDFKRIKKTKNFKHKRIIPYPLFNKVIIEYHKVCIEDALAGGEACLPSKEVGVLSCIKHIGAKSGVETHFFKLQNKRRDNVLVSKKYYDMLRELVNSGFEYPTSSKRIDYGR